MEDTNIGSILLLLVVYGVSIYGTYLYWFQPEKAREMTLRSYARSRMNPLGFFSSLARTSLFIWINRFGGLLVVIIVTLRLVVMIENVIEIWK